MVSARPNPLRVETVDPFEVVRPTDPSEETLSDETDARTIFLPDAAWKAVALTDLRDVEDLLDSLELSCVVEREMRTLGNSSFAVRWR